MVLTERSRPANLLLLAALVATIVGGWDSFLYGALFRSGYGLSLDRIVEMAGCLILFAVGAVAILLRHTDPMHRTVLLCAGAGIASAFRNCVAIHIYSLELLAVVAMMGILLGLLVLAYSVLFMKGHDQGLPPLMLCVAMLLATDIVSVAFAVTDGYGWPLTLTFYSGALPFTPVFLFIILVMRRESVSMIPKNGSGDPDLMVLLGISMSLAGSYYTLDSISSVYPYLEFLVDASVISSLIGGILMFIGGIFVLSSGRYRYWLRSAVAGFFISVSFVLRNVGYVYPENGTASFVVAIIALLVGTSAIIASVSMAFGYKHYASRLFQGAAVMLCVELFPFYICYHYLVPVPAVLALYHGIIPFVVVYAILLVVLHHESVRVVPVTERVDSDMCTISGMQYSDGDSYILPEDAASIEDLVSSNRNAELRLTLFGGSEERAIKFVSTSEGTVMGTVVPSEGTNLFDGFRFEADVVVRTDDGIRIYGREGVFVQILVHPRPPEKSERRMRLFLRHVAEDE